MTKSQDISLKAVFLSLVVILTLLGNTIRFGPFSITLSLTPIIIASAIFGPHDGAIFGAVFGAVVLLSGVLGMDGGTTMFLMGQNLPAVIAICLIKGIVAGFVAGLTYKAFSKKNDTLAVVLAGIICPVVNTGLFILGMIIFFMSTLQSWANGEKVIYYIIFGLTGINFLIELTVNIVLSSITSRLIRYRIKSKKIQ